MPSEPFAVTGKIVFERVSKPFENATAYIKLEDISKMDAPSKVITRQIIRNVNITHDECVAKKFKEIEFSLRCEIKDTRGMYVVNAHIDVDGDGKVSVGDYITTAYYPVLTRGFPNNVDIVLKEVS